MLSSTRHVKSLIGRIFSLCNEKSIAEWNGYKDTKDIVCDYDMIDDYISYQEGDMTLYEKSESLHYYLYFAMSSKIEIFQTERGMVICDGLYLNESFNYSQQVEFNIINSIPLTLTVDNEFWYLFDAAIEGSSIIEIHKNDFLLIDFLKYGKYTLHQVEATILHNDEEVVLKGVNLTEQFA